MSRMTLAVAGLKDVRRGLRGIDKDLPKGMRLALNQVAQVVVDGARPLIPSVSGAARGSVRAASSQTAARVAAGGAKAPYYPWLDFGGSVGRNRSVKRPFYKEGRYIFVTVAKSQDAIQRAMLDAVAELGRSNGIEVT